MSHSWREFWRGHSGDIEAPPDQDHVGSDDRVEAAQRLQFAEGCCRRARILVEKNTGPPGQRGDPEARD